MRYHIGFSFVCGAAAAVVLLALGGCPPPQPPDDTTTPVFNNTTDATNDGAAYIGSAACSACHPDVAEVNRIHGHFHALNAVAGQPPTYAPEGDRAGVPNPPDGKTWTDVSYVIAGYLHGTYFVDQDGFRMTDGVEGVNTLWQLDFPLNGTTAGFVESLPDQDTPLPYAYECFKCHTVGPQAQDPNDPAFQDGRPGILGTWAEAGVKCEACHGPGSKHAPNPEARNIFVDFSAQTCARCHTGGDDCDVIVASNGFVDANAQYAELLASGGHADFSCMVCHAPHASTFYDRENGIRNECTACHTDMNLPFHDGIVYILGDEVEMVSCESCHMPLTGKSASSGSIDQFGEDPRIGDVRSHIFRLSTANADFNSMLTDDGTAVRKDDQGRAAITLDFVCLRCHNGAGNAFRLDVNAAAGIARDMHAKTQ